MAGSAGTMGARDPWPERVISGVAGIWATLVVLAIVDPDRFPIPDAIYGVLAATITAYFTYRGLTQRAGSNGKLNGSREDGEDDK